jgi:hypothetical protein
VLAPFQQLAEELLGGLLVTPRLDQDVQHLLVVIDGAPERRAGSMARPKDFIERPCAPGLGRRRRR